MKIGVIRGSELDDPELSDLKGEKLFGNIFTIVRFEGEWLSNSSKNTVNLH